MISRECEEMEKGFFRKKIGIIACGGALVVLAAVVVCVLLLSGRDKYYRSVLVYELNGSAVIERADVGTIDAAENLYLESGDRVSVDDDSTMRIKLDDDKYVTAEAGAVFTLEAKGDAQESKTRIQVERGAVMNEIQNPLSKGSVYETSTPNSVMAVRGTIYRVELCDDGQGGQSTRMCCFEGAVAVTPVSDDGGEAETVLVPAGSEITSYDDGTVGEVQEIDYQTLPEEAIETLYVMADRGVYFTSITREELGGMLTAFTQDVADTSAADVASARDTAAQNTDAAQEGDASGTDDDDDDAATQASAEDADTAAAGRPAAAPENRGGEDAAEAEAEQSDAQEQTDGDGTAVTAQNNNASSQGTSTVTGSTDTGAASGGSQSGNNGSQQSSGSQSGGSQQSSGGEQKPGGGHDITPGGDQKDPDDHGDTDDKDDPDDGHDKDDQDKDEKEECTVTFWYGSKPFAKQTVKNGGTAHAPSLKPSASGSWQWDFGTVVTADQNIYWQ